MNVFIKFCIWFLSDFLFFCEWTYIEHCRLRCVGAHRRCLSVEKFSKSTRECTQKVYQIPRKKAFSPEFSRVFIDVRRTPQFEQFLQSANGFFWYCSYVAECTCDVFILLLCSWTYMWCFDIALMLLSVHVRFWYCCYVAECTCEVLICSYVAERTCDVLILLLCCWPYMWCFDIALMLLTVHVMFWYCSYVADRTCVWYCSYVADRTCDVLILLLYMLLRVHVMFWYCSYVAEGTCDVLILLLYCWPYMWCFDVAFMLLSVHVMFWYCSYVAERTCDVLILLLCCWAHIWCFNESCLGGIPMNYNSYCCKIWIHA